MSIGTSLPESLPRLTAPVRRGRPLLAWLVIAGIVGFILWRAAIEAAPGRQAVELIMMEVQARNLVGLATLTGQRDANFYEQAKALNRGPYDQRLRFIALAGELAGPAEARKQLAELERMWSERQEQPSDEQKTIAVLLERLYLDYEQGEPSAPSLSEADREELRRDLGWFGELALAPPRDAKGAEQAPVRAQVQRAVTLLIVAGLGWFVVGLVGFVLLLVVAILAAVGYLRGHFHTGSPNGGLYAETFAVWLALFLALSYGAAHLPLTEGRLLVGGLAMLASLAALAWPVLRGASWAQVRREVGLCGGSNPAVEPAVGLGCYAAALPLLLIGGILSLWLMYLHKRYGLPEDPFGPSDAPSHPVIGYVVHADGWGLLQVLFLVSVVAPLVEETMFRGVLYRHLREASGGMRRWVSVLVSALVVSFVFAVIHPQGWFGVPALMALAMAFALAREWRDTLVPSMIAHGIHNGLLLAMMLLMSR
jgi:membrane protease YdiL (CAAX protease family)